ncbi:hypothetical protein J2Y55_002240 [Bosea sp. BE125]|uniref:hypothetical protein n=1 Tax=Bosea sp. BE125 TaxID=2817909 RepID=UPI0028574D37|nr:hypothetical protein [Bosea sp. BE125]MDR6871228.1 hypothetical protein [Bosea sp. BE125]
MGIISKAMITEIFAPTLQEIGLKSDSRMATTITIILDSRAGALHPSTRLDPLTIGSSATLLKRHLIWIKRLRPPGVIRYRGNFRPAADCSRDVQAVFPCKIAGVGGVWSQIRLTECGFQP